MRKAVKIALSFGGDLGDSAAVFATAAKLLVKGGVTELRLSSLFFSSPVDCVPGTPDFTNQAATGVWFGTSDELLALTQSVETELGRPAEHSSCEARVFDCDIVLFGAEVVNSPRLTLPHPRARRREFVLCPLAELAPGWKFPDTGETVAEALVSCQATACIKNNKD